MAAFAERGFHGTTTRDIATAAGMSPAAVYVHHRSKEELLYEICLLGHQDILEVVRSAAAAPGTPSQRLAEATRAFVTDHARNHVVARVVNYELGALSAEHRSEVLALRQAIDAMFRTIVDEGTKSGEFTTSDPSMATTALVSLGIDVARWYRDGGRWSAARIGEFYADLALRIVGAEH